MNRQVYGICSIEWLRRSTDEEMAATTLLIVPNVPSQVAAEAQVIDRNVWSQVRSLLEAWTPGVVRNIGEGLL
jgi:hypothetical protein